MPISAVVADTPNYVLIDGNTYPYIEIDEDDVTVEHEANRGETTLVLNKLRF